MRNLAMVALVSAGLLVGWYMTHNHYQGQLVRMEREQVRSEAERRQQLATLSKGYYETYQDAINREPVTVERRVYVKANCVSAGSASGVGDATDAGGRAADSGAAGGVGRVALSQSTVDAVLAVADKQQRLYDACRAKLEYFQKAYEQQGFEGAALHGMQRKIKTHNELQR